MAEEVKKTKPKQNKEVFEYKLMSHGDKLSLLLEGMYELEQALFNHNINRLDEKHSEYPAWKATNDELEAEVYRLRYIYEKMGGGWDNAQEYDEYGEPI